MSYVYLIVLQVCIQGHRFIIKETLFVKDQFIEPLVVEPHHMVLFIVAPHVIMSSIKIIKEVDIAVYIMVPLIVTIDTLVALHEVLLVVKMSPS